MIFYPDGNFVQFTRRIRRCFAMTSWKIVKMSGEAEPWWFFPDWKKDIKEELHYSTEKEAFEQYINLIEEYNKAFQHAKHKKNTAAFWNEDEKVFCEACDDDLQLYHGLILMEDEKVKEFTEEEKKKFYSSFIR
ncbi:DUF1033 family protein [Rossellomorea aquimaris]|uniref:DUF1033 family protein n=2 Tax=Bacillaceae TaxID=186817 RepID=A0A5D4U5Y6_9BACI|nr:DUF1033 family protein [Rossellomorea aquimaris]